MIKKTSNLIIPGGSGNPRTQAVTNPYNPTSPDTQKKLIQGRIHSPNLIRTSGGSTIRRTGTLATGSSGTPSQGGAQSVAQSPLYYDYRWSTPDKFYFPRNRVVANAIWREIYKRDAVVAIATDMYADLPWSDFDLVGIDDNSVKKVYEDMFSAVNLVPMFEGLTRNYLVLGELVLHVLYNSTKGIWERVISHNPDYIRAEGIGLVMEQPLLWLMPTPEIKRLLSSNDPRIRKLQKLLPKEMINAFRQNRDVPLDSLNTTFLSRKNDLADIRGTSIYTRLYRTVMYEDFVVNASLAVSQRMAAPLRIFKLGDPATGWLPTEDDEAAFAEMLSMAESDPLAAIIMHHNVSCELVGVADRALLISREWDFIERAKLLGMGVAKSFLVGETSFASATAGLQTLLTRLAAMRMKFEKEWIIKKLCKPMAEMHDFYKRSEAELSHRIRIQRNDEQELIVPTLKWRKSLESTEDTALLGIWRDLKDRGMLSDRTYGAGAGIDLDVERNNQEEERKWVEDHPEYFPSAEEPAKMGGPGGAPGGKPGGKPPPAGPLPSPLPLPGQHAESSKQASLSLYNDFEEQMEEFIVKGNMINAEDVLEIAQNIEDKSKKEDGLRKKLTALEQSLPSDKNILNGQ